MNFYEKWTKITLQTHIRKFEILEITLWNSFHSTLFRLDWFGTLFWTELILTHCDLTDVVWEMKDFKFSDASLGSYFCSFLRKSHHYFQKILFNLWPLPPRIQTSFMDDPWSVCLHHDHNLKKRKLIPNPSVNPKFFEHLKNYFHHHVCTSFRSCVRLFLHVSKD